MSTREESPSHSLSDAPLRVRLILLSVLGLITALLFGTAGWALLPAAAQWPATVTATGWSLLILAGALTLAGMLVANGPRADSDTGDRWARVAHTLLGLGWLGFSWGLLAVLLVRLPLVLAGVPDPLRSRLVSAGLLVVLVLLAVTGARAALRVPGVRRVEVVLDRLPAAFDGLRVAVITDTHLDAFTGEPWARRLTEAVNDLEPDVVLHAGDLADGSVARRRPQVAHLGDVAAPQRFYIAGNHEYYSDAAGWIEVMGELGWTTLVNQHVVLERDGSRLVVAGLDDPTGTSMPGRGPDPEAALAGTHADDAIVLLAHQPHQVRTVVDRVDLQVSGHTHGGQIWPFHLLVRLREPVVQGLSRHGGRTQLWTSRGSGFWGPPFRVLAPSEISLLTLRRPPGSPATR